MGATTKKTTRERTSRCAKKADRSIEKARKDALAVIDESLAAIDGKEPKAEAASRRSKKPTATKASAKKKAAAKTRSSKPKGKGKLSALDAAAKVLAGKGEPMRCHEIVDVMLEKKLWSTQGKTPAATLYSAILREIQKKGEEGRFEKVDRGRFQLRKGV